MTGPAPGTVDALLGDLLAAAVRVGDQPVLRGASRAPLGRVFLAVGRSTSLRVCIEQIRAVASDESLTNPPPWFAVEVRMLDALAATPPYQRDVPMPWEGYRTDSEAVNFLLKSVEAAWDLAMTPRSGRRHELGAIRCYKHLEAATYLFALSRHDPGAELLRPPGEFHRQAFDEWAARRDPLFKACQQQFVRAFSATVRRVTAAR